MRSLTKHIWAVMLVAAVCVSATHAQQPTAPAAPTSPTSQQSSGTSQQGGQLGTTGQVSGREPASPAMGPAPVVTGGLAPKAGTIGDTESQIRFGFQVGELFDTNYQVLTAPSGFDSVSILSGHFDLKRLSSNSVFGVRYAGGGYIDSRNTQFDSTFHQFDVSESIQFQRWTLTIDDLFGYLPESSFGFGAAGLGGGTLIGPTLVDPSVTPNQSIITPQSKRLSNTLLAQAQILASERTNWTITGSYGLLHYFTSGFLEPTSYSFGAGYNYLLSQRGTLGVSYTYNAIRFNPALSSINDSTILVTYGHRITGRWVIQGGIGPDINTFTPVGGTAGTRVFLGANAGLNYVTERTTLTGAFSRGTSGGGGVLLGAASNNLTFGVNHKAGAKWSLAGSIGVSFNASLPQASLTTSSYTGLFAGAGATWQISEGGSIFFNYSYQHQSTNVVCGGPTCAPAFSRNQFWVGFNFDFRPIRIK
jgi:hypothetical protein